MHRHVSSTRARLLACAALALFTSFVAVAPAQASTASLQVTQSLVVGGGSQVTSLTLPAGGAATLLVDYKCASTVAACQNAEISIPIPAGVATGAVTPSSDVASVDSVGSQRVINMNPSLAAGTTGSITIALSVPAWTTADSSILSWVATMGADNADAVSSAPITLTVQSAGTTSANGSETSGGAVGDVTTYSVSGCDAAVADPSQGPLGVQAGSQLAVTIPAGASVLSDGGGNFIAGGSGQPGMLTFTLAAVDGGCPGDSFQLSYPSGANSSGDSETLNVTWVGAMVGASSVSTLGTATITNSLTSPQESGSFSNSISTPRSSNGTPSGAVGDLVSYNMAADNTGTQTWNALTVSDPIPSILEVSTIVASNPGEDPATVWITSDLGQDGIANTADDSTPWQIATVAPHSSTTIDVYSGAAALPAGDWVTSVQLRMSTIYPGASSTPLSIQGTILATSHSSVASSAGTTFADVATFTPTVASGSTPAVVTREADGVVDVPTPGVYVRQSGGTVPVGSRQTSFDLSAVPVFGDDLPDPIWVVQLPPGVSLASWVNPTGMPQATLTTIPNWGDVDGDTLLRWTFPKGTVLAKGDSSDLHYTVQLDPSLYTPETVMGWIYTGDANVNVSCGDNWFDGSPDTGNRSGDGNTSAVLCPWFAGVSFPTNASAQLTTSVKGSWDGDFADGPAVGYSTPGSQDEYRITLQSQATMNLDQAVIIDTLPRPGDTAVLSSTQRNPSTGTFPVYLAARPTVPTLGSSVTTYYTTVTDPCRSELSYSPGGCNTPDWVDWDVTAPSDLTQVTAVKFDFGANVLDPGVNWQITMHVTEPTTGPDAAVVNPDPTNAAADEVAYDSAGFVVRRDDLDVDLLPSEAPAVGLDMPSVYGPPGARPTAAPQTTTGTGTAQQTTTLSIPAHGSVSLMDGLTPVSSLHVDGVGDYSLDPTTGVITFTPALGFQGAAPAVGYRRTDVWGQSAIASYIANVTPPSAPSAAAQATTGTGAAVQVAGVTAPAGATLALIGAGALPVSSITIAGKGTYAVTNGQLTFTPDSGYAGTPPAVTYQLTDAYGQAAQATYQATVNAPAQVAAVPAQTSGGPGAAQSYTVAIPAGGSVTLLDASGQPTDSVTVAGEGTYTLDPSSGTITFAPAAGFVGQGAGVKFQVTDVYGRTSVAGYSATVLEPAAPMVAPAATAPPAATPTRAAVVCVSRRTMVIHFRVPTHTSLSAIAVTINGAAYKALASVRRDVEIDLRGRGAGTFEISVVAHTKSGRMLGTLRTYHTCRAPLSGPKLLTLELGPERA